MEQLIEKWNPNNETDKEFQVQGSKPIFLINIFLMPSSELQPVVIYSRHSITFSFTKHSLVSVEQQPNLMTILHLRLVLHVCR